MKKQPASEKSMLFLTFLCCLSYFTSYLTRLNYAACLIEIQDALQIGKSQASLPVTGCFLVYGTGQLICGFFGDKIAPHKIIFAGLLGTAICNLLIVIFPHIAVITVVWCANGFFQSMLWPPMVRIMAEVLDEAWYRRCSVLVSFASSLGTIMIYVLAPVCLSLWGWKTMFLAPAILALAVAFYWVYHTQNLTVKFGTVQSAKAGLDKRKEMKHGILKVFYMIPLVQILLVIALHGILKDGIITWMPAYMADSFGMSTSMSILTTSVLPVFSIVSTLLASLLFYRIRDELRTALALFGVSLVSALMMILVNGKHPLGCILLMMLITGCMYGVNLMLISRVPRHFAGLGMVSTVSGVLNAATYAGSALSTYGFGKIAENGGWNHVISLWIGVCVSAVFLLLISGRRWTDFVRANKSE